MTKPPTLDDLKAEVDLFASFDADRSNQALVEAEVGQDSLAFEHRYNQMVAYRSHHRNKARWSIFVMGLMAAMVGFQCILLWKVGAGVWNFIAYPWLIQALLVTNFAEIAALAMVIVKALHDGHKD